MKVGSLFAGVGGFDLAFQRAGMKVAWSCEIDPRCRQVLERRFPGSVLYDDVTTLKGSDVAAVDVLCGGWPCQDLSVAGKRAGLAGERSGLFHQFARLASELGPRWVVGENVPGLLSSEGGDDFATVVDTLVELGYGVAWRVLDAQFFGVAQRRRRVFVVGCAGDPRAAAEVLLEPESGGGDSPPRREAGTRVAALTANGVGAGGGPDDNAAQAGHLIARCLTSRNERIDWETETFLPVTVSNDSTPVVGEDVCSTLKPGTGLDLPSMPAVAYQCHGSNVGEMGTLRQGNGALTGGVPFVAAPVAVRGREDGQEWEVGDEGVYNALRAGDGGSSRGNWVMAFSENQRGEVLETDYSHQLTVGGGKPGQGFPAARVGMAVRRLTPLECERLQGFPDDWTEGFPDSFRYKAMGNAVAVPVVEWIARRIAERAA